MLQPCYTYVTASQELQSKTDGITFQILIVGDLLWSSLVVSDSLQEALAIVYGYHEETLAMVWKVPCQGHLVDLCAQPRPLNVP